MAKAYRYSLGSNISMQEVQDSLMMAILAMECIYGSAQARLDLSHEFDPKKRICVIDASSPVGQHLNRLFTGFLLREFGPASFRVKGVNGDLASEIAMGEIQ